MLQAVSRLATVTLALAMIARLIYSVRRRDPVRERGAEGATRPETLRQKDCGR